MTKQELEEFKTMLEEKRIEIMRDLGLLETRSMNATTADSSGGPIYSDHMPELGSDAIEREKAFMFATRDGVYISQLEDASGNTSEARSLVASIIFSSTQSSLQFNFIRCNSNFSF